MKARKFPKKKVSTPPRQQIEIVERDPNSKAPVDLADYRAGKSPYWLEAAKRARENVPGL